MIKAIISDFDGTLVDTFDANFAAYSEAFTSVGLSLSREKYRECFGLRFPELMEALGISEEDIALEIRRIKGEVYPNYFSKLKPNMPLVEFLRSSKRQGIRTALASTARGKNLKNALLHIEADDVFTHILTGEDVKKGKPNPEIYNRALELLCVSSDEAIVFEDSEVGMKAAEAAGINYIKVDLALNK